uniref:PPM-type phosphatase domain-containing protein n=1 Tax=Vitis vinifera TaxID=29760 RepID=F6HZE8_VITVI
MGNSTSRVVGCFVPFNGKGGVDLDLLEPLDEGLGHSFCYVRPMILDSPAITPSNSERFTVDSSTLDSETLSGSFRHENIDDPSAVHRPNKCFPETTFKAISGASVSANVSTARTGNSNALFTSDAQEPAASFESTSSFAAIPLQPVPRGSGPLNGFMSGPLERGVMSGPLDATDKSNFSAPLAHGRRRPGLQRLMRSVSGPMKSTLSRTFSRHSIGSSWMQRFFLHPVTQFAWHPREPKFRPEAPRNCLDVGPSEGEYRKTHNLQWAHGKAGEDRVHVVLSEEQGWLFIGIYDGFSGPDAPDFLMSHLYKAIDKELEGLLWDYEEKSVNDLLNLELPMNRDATNHATQELSGITALTPGVLGVESIAAPTANLTGQGRKSKRLYELLQMESWDGESSLSVSEGGNQRRDSSSQYCEDPTTSGENGGIRMESNSVLAPLSVSEQRQGMRKSLISSKIRKMYRKQKSLRKKLFPWSYDWHREETCVDDRMAETSGPVRRCKSGVIDHDAVLRAMARALETTEEAYMEMVEKALDKNPELALMGSCVLVMLMKDQDVYVMNLGDSRVILAQERPNDRHPNPNLAKDDVRHRNRSRESLVRMELDRISEESPMHNQNCQVNKANKNREISFCRLKMRAVQLSTDHSTSIEEEVLRIKAEHVDDNQAILNDRVKGQLKVTRAFGAGFLKEPKCNEALLEMFQIDYVGTTPYVSCIPSVLHHRLSSSDRFLVLSSDGLYQYFSNEEVVAHVTWFMENVPEGDPAQYLIAELLFRAAKKNGMDFHELLDIPHGDRRKYHDDVSVMVVSLEGRIWRSSG